MNDFHRTAAEADCVIRAMQSVATLSGRRVPQPIERELIRAVQRHVLRANADLDQLPHVSATELRQRLRDPDQRAWLVRCAILVPYVSLEVEPAKVAAVDALAMQLGTSPDVLRDLHRQREQQLERIALDQGRRGGRIYLTVRTSAQLRAIVDALQRRDGDCAMAARYGTLGRLPAGTLGRALFDLHGTSGLPLPGELRAVDETLVAHDLLHVIGGFACDPAGETAMVGFAAGLERKPMGRQLLLEAIVERHAVLHLSGALAGGEPGPSFDAAALTAAYDRGVAASATLVRGWSWWQDAATELDTLRARFGVRIARPARPAAAGAAAREPRAA